MYYKIDKNGKIYATSIENYDGEFLYTDKKIIKSIRGDFFFEDEINTEEFVKREERFTKLQNEAREIRSNLNKWKEDIEQVELFGMERSDCEEKKQMCANAVQRLREINKLLL